MPSAFAHQSLLVDRGSITAIWTDMGLAMNEPNEEFEGGDPNGETGSFSAACETGHQWLGPTRKGSTAFEDAQKDADQHNEKFPGHEAAVIGA